MKETVENDQSSIDLKAELEADNELNNDHIYHGAPTVSDDTKPEVEPLSNPSKPTNKEPSNPSKWKGRFIVFVKGILLVSLLLVLGLAAIWVFANRAVLFPSADKTLSRPAIVSVDEVSQKINVDKNPYATQQDLRNLSSGLRKDFKEALREFSRGLDKIDIMQDKISTMRSQINELKTHVLQLPNENTSASNKNYNSIIAKMNALETTINGASLNKSQIEELQALNKKRSLLEVHLKNNDWDLRKRMERLEENAGISQVKSLSKGKKNTPSKKVNKFSAAMTPETTQKRPTATAKKKIKYETVKLASSKAVVWENQHRWKIRMISDALTQIQNIDTGTKIRISEGVDVRGCGLVLAIDVPERKVTTQHCIISTSGK
jgi:hypothetical protein